ncbi:DUF2975 domain-containing protein [Agromyces sp. GXS1127]|uniref:DUF2975 domain-containing protein n=1 Tax=Agromyces sp. GXS1127 TaxID=3424181 RepID=UPI003D323F48
MLSLERVIIPLRILIVLVFAGLVVAQVMSLPGEFAQQAREAPELGAAPWILLAFGIFEILCVQVVLVCIWRLLSLIGSDRIFSAKAFVWVDVMAWAIVVAWLALVGVAVWLMTLFLTTPELRDPGNGVIPTGLVLIGGVVVLVVVVLRALLHRAAEMRSDLEEVI